MSDSHHASESIHDTQLATPEHGDTYEADCIDLLCKQENALSLMGEVDRESRSLESLELAKTMLVHFLDFADSHLDDKEFSGISQRLSQVYQNTKEHEQRSRQQSWSLIRSFVGLKSPDTTEVDEAYEQLRKEYVELYREFFDVCAAKFSEHSTTKEQFLQSVDLFIDEIERKW